MKKFFASSAVLLILSATVCFFSSCEEDWSAMTWAIENSNSEHIKVDQSLAQVTIVADKEGGEVVCTCENYDELYMLYYGTQPMPDEFVNDDYSVKAEGNKIIVNFKKRDELMEEGYPLAIINVRTKNNNHPETFFMIYRDNNLKIGDETN